jgi:thioredoxin 1
MGSFKEIISKDKPVLVDFTASWCGPCKVQAPILEQVKGEVGDRAKIVKIDVDKNPSIAQSLNIQGVPTLILYRAGKQLWRKSGVVDKNTLVALIQQHGK